MSTATSYMDDDEEPFIIFTEVEMEHLPVSDAVLHILITAGRLCYRFLHPTKSGMSVQDCWAHYTRSNYCAFLLMQRIDRGVKVDLAAFCTRIYVPHIKDTMPVFIAAYEKTRSLWTDIYVDYFVAAHTVLDDIGGKMYPDSFDRDVIRQLNDFFEDLLGGGEIT